jgi:ubiquitin carboxyl-terminal hydrolase L3
MANWIPLESNPEVINKYMQKLGLESGAEFGDVYGCDDALLDMVPDPCYAFILLFPITQKYEDFRVEESKTLPTEFPNSLFFMKQTVGNACGTIGLIHALANNLDNIKLKEGSTLYNFIKTGEEKSSDEIAEMLENDDSFQTAHEDAGNEGQTSYNEEDKIDLHFVAIIDKDGKMWELDGRKTAPVCHGESDDSGFKKNAAKICMKFMQRDPEELRFTMLALSKN